MTTPRASATFSVREKKLAKRLRRLVKDENADHPEWSHMRCLNAVVMYAETRPDGMSDEEFVAHIFVSERAKGRGLSDEEQDKLAGDT